MNGPNLQVETIVDGLDLFDDDEFEHRTQVDDPISALVGAHAYVEAHRDDACTEAIGDGSVTEPRTFDRFYFERDLLIDVIDGVSDEEEERIENEKHVAFKRAWCAEHDRRYVAIRIREFETDPVGFFERELTPLGLTQPTGPEDPPAASTEPVTMTLGPSAPPAALEQRIAEAGHDGPLPEIHSDAYPPDAQPLPARDLDDSEVTELDAQAAAAGANPLSGVDIAELGYEITEEPLALEDDNGVTRPAEPQAESDDPQPTPEDDLPPAASVPEPPPATRVQKAPRKRHGRQH